MATTFPLPTLGPTLTLAGISTPTFAEIFQSLQVSFQSIYGTDSYIDPDSQDGQMLAIVAKAIYDCNQTAIAVYNSYSPSKAQGEALSANVKINGITRKVATRSTVLLSITGQAGSVINNGVVKDSASNVWDLPASVVIGSSGTVSVTATAREAGSITVAAGEVTVIDTPTLGWQTVTNPSPAAIGAPVEQDADLRVRQALATALPSFSVISSIRSALSNIPGVIKSKVYENDTNATDANGIPEHSIAAVVYGGDATEIATTLRLKKTPGASTFGTTTVAVADELGDLINISYLPVDIKTINVKIQITPRVGYLTTTADLIKQAILEYVNSLDIGQRVDQGRLYLPAQLYGTGPFRTYEVNGVQLSIAPAAVTNADVTIAFDEMAVTTLANIVVEIV